MRLGVTIALILLAAVPATSQAPQPASLSDLLDRFEKESVFWKQIEVAKQIVAAKDTSVLPRLEPWLTHDDRHLRGNAAFIFASLGDARGFETIVAILGDRSERPPGQTGTARPSLQAQIREDRYYAAHLLGDLKDPRAIPILVPLLQDPDVKFVVPWSLGQIADPAVIPPLLATLNDPDPSMRVMAIEILADLKAIEALPRLRQLLDDKERANFGKQQSVTDTARDAIAKLRPEDRR
jgi:HEAT repeat protein